MSQQPGQRVFCMTRVLKVRREKYLTLQLRYKSYKKSCAMPSLAPKRTATDNAVLDALLSVDLFQDWPSELLERLIPYMKLEDYAPGEVVFDEGDPGLFMGIVVSGKLGVEKFNSFDARVELAKLLPGRIFGEMALLDGERRSASVFATEEASILTLSASNLELISEKYPPLALALLKKIALNLSRRLRSADGRLVG
jgi:CRP-like cAMP-binding protein